MADVTIDPTENRDQHCKIYVERSLFTAIRKQADMMGISFSEAGRQLMIWGLQRGDW